jgi:hypothetical protein
MLKRKGLSVYVISNVQIRVDDRWMANYKAYKEGLENMPHRC